MASIPEVSVVEPGFVFEVQLFQILKRNPLLLLPAPVEQALHTTLKNTGMVNLKASPKYTK